MSAYTNIACVQHVPPKCDTVMSDLKKITDRITQIRYTEI